MKLSKIVLACLGLSVTAFASASQAEYSLDTAKDYLEFKSHQDYLSNFIKKTDELNKNFAIEIAKTISEKTKVQVDEHLKVQQNVQVNVHLDKLQKVLEDHKKKIKEIWEKPNAKTSEVATEAAGENRKAAQELQQALTEVIPGTTLPEGPATQAFLKFLNESPKELENIAKLNKENADRYAAAYDSLTPPASGFFMSKLDTSKIEHAVLENGGHIYHLQKDVAQNRADIKALRKEHRQSIAQVAAMSSIDFGLVKARTIKVGGAVGHYKDQSAIALGAAIAPTDKWLINTRISSTTGKGKNVILGMGATYEFSY